MRPASIVLCLPLLTGVFAQTGPALYWVRFTDKASTPYSLTTPEAYLSERSISRRTAQGIAIDSLDLPIDPLYISELLAAGDFTLVNRHKWFNAVTIASTDTLALDSLDLLPHVGEVRMLHDGRQREHTGRDKFACVEKQGIGGYYTSIYGAALRQVEMMNVHLLHEHANARGEGMLLGVLDSGFEGVDSLPAFAALRARDGIVVARDFSYPPSDVFNDHWHGRSVLGCIAAYLPGQLVGTAPGVDVALLRTEVAATEYLVEEDNWVSGAEFADSLGCDILTTSLGYSTFDDSTQDHSYADMDGLTTRISIASGIAARKGIVVVNSAGNSGNNPWHYITAPADAVGILAVGAVGTERRTATFSSRGPSVDGRVKPEVAAVGWGTAGMGADGNLANINGTSFSGPLVAGGVACLWQLHPDRSAEQIVAAVMASASLHHRPDDEQGHGIPDFWRAHLLLGGTDLTGLRASTFFELWPVPFTDGFDLALFTGGSDRVRVELFDPSGRKVWEGADAVDHDVYTILRVDDAALRGLVPGCYVLRATTGSADLLRPVIKLDP